MNDSDPREIVILLMYAYVQGKSEGYEEAIRIMAENWPVEEVLECGSSSLDS